MQVSAAGTPYCPRAFVLEHLGSNQEAEFGLDSKLYMVENKWSGRVDLNHRPPGPEPGAKAC